MKRNLERIITKVLLYAIAFYRKYISNLMLPRCRHYPTCSSYAYQALSKKGLWKGLALTIRRVLRCHPFSRAPYYDPVQ